MSDDLHRGRHRAPAGRHRAQGRARTHAGLPRLSRLSTTGYLLPTATVAAVALTAAGVQMGASGAAFGLSTASAAPGAGLALMATSSATADPIERIAQQSDARASRSSARLTGGTVITSGSTFVGASADATGSGASGGVATDGTDALGDAVPATDGVSTDSAASSRAAAEAAAGQAAETAAAQAAAAQTAASQAAAAQSAAAQTAKTAAAAHAWVSPIASDAGFQLTSGFGMRWGAMHPGQDFAVAVGTPVHALSSGTVILAGWEGGYGNKVEIQYWDGTVSWMAHNSRLLVKVGDAVTPGETVSLSGNTGHSTGPHVHLEIHPGNGSPVSPVPWLTAKGILP